MAAEEPSTAARALRARPATQTYARQPDNNVFRTDGTRNSRWTDPKRGRPRAPREMLFPTGLEILKLPYLEEHAESQKRLDLIDEHKIDKVLLAALGARSDRRAAYRGRPLI